MPTPLVDTQRGWRQWYIGEIYTGTGPGEMVPNVDDAVLEWTSTGREVYRVTAVNPDNTVVLVPTNDDPGAGGVTQEDVLLGSGPGTQGETFRVYINKTVTPYVMAFDSFLYINGSDPAYIKVFRGTDISALTGHVISAMFSGPTFLSENIPLEMVENPVGAVVAKKTPMQAWCTEPLMDDEVVTAVVYNASGDVKSWSKLIVRVTDFVRSISAEAKYVVNIELLSPYISVADDHILEVPANMILQSTSLQGKVYFSDGSTETLPIDGTRFKLLGIDNFAATILGQTVPLVLVYTLQNDEYAYFASAPLPDRFVSEEYSLTVAEAVGAYSVKLFVVPEWVTSPTPQWTLKYYLYNLERNVLFDATAYVTYGTMGGFNGTLLNVPQRVVVGVNLQEVSPSYDIYRHIQTFTVTLKASGANAFATNYATLEYTPEHVHGSSLIAPGAIDNTDPTKWKLDLSLNLVDTTEWLTRTFWPTEPLQSLEEAAAPVPTHVRVRVGNVWVREMLIAQALLPVYGISTEPVQGSAVRLEFFKRIGSTEYELGCSYMTVKR